MYLKENKVYASWLVEVKNLNPETVNNKQYFAEYMEDFNTGTLPNMLLFFNAVFYWEWSAGIGQDISTEQGNLKLQVRILKNRLAELNRVPEERTAADRLRKLGIKQKDSMGVRYDEEY
ncbi:hypothetical protein BC829DRAFT_379653 [Chytridium lagenaria]|nr:hypothetical protein BC829DRAFT_379653 [Chytridium lagenaria]